MQNNLFKEPVITGIYTLARYVLYILTAKLQNIKINYNTNRGIIPAYQQNFAKNIVNH